MWGASEEPPGTMEAGPPETVADLKETCEQSKNQLETVKDMMLRNKQSLKQKEEELQEYAAKLSKYKSRAKASKAKKDDATSSSESTPKSKPDVSILDQSDDMVDDISEARTPKAKSSLLQKKLAEDRKIFEQRTKELIESKKAAEERVEALKQQLEEKYVTPVSPVLVSSQGSIPVIELSHVQDKDNKIAELSNKIFELEATIIDLRENLKEKDSVIDSKTKAITLMSADLSKKGKTTLDTLEDTKDEMRSMQENFVLVETSLRDKNDNLLKQLEEKTAHISTLEENVQSLMEKLDAQKQAETVSADFSRSTMDTLADTKDAMKSMQENFVLIETSLKSKNEHLLKQLEEREIKLAEAQEKIFNLESGLGIERQPNLEDLEFKITKLEETNKNLLDEKYELQKSIASLQDKIISNESSNNDSQISDLESLIEELKRSNQTLQTQKEELSTQVVELTGKTEEMCNKVTVLEKQVNELESEKTELATKLSIRDIEAPAEDERVQKLTQELDELNKSMIKLKAQHKNKLKNLQKQLENFKKVSDTNAELVKLGNQVALLEEEKGNLQLSLVDFDELKASTGDWQARIADLEGKVSAQANEIQSHIEAIAILENQKLDLIQELHAVKQEVSDLEAENAESENLRVTAEMKVVDLEEELESLHKLHAEPPLMDQERSELQRQIESLTQKISKLEELKSSSDVGSTESFVKTGSNVDSTESFEALSADADKADLLKKIDGLMRENGALLEKLTRFEEKGSSDTGSTESFERIPEQSESSSKIDNLTRENYELVVKLTKLEEKLAAQFELDNQLTQENERMISQISELRERLAQLEVEKSDTGREKRSIEETTELEPTTETQTEEVATSDIPSSSVDVEELLLKVESLTAYNEILSNSLAELEKEKLDLLTKLEEKVAEKNQEVVAEKLHEVEPVIVPTEEPVVESAAQQEDSAEDSSSAAIASLEGEIEFCNKLIADQKVIIEEMKMKLAEKQEELEHKSAQLTRESETCDVDVKTLRRELEESASVIVEWKLKFTKMEDKMEALEQGKRQIEEGFRTLQEENKNLAEASEQKDALVTSLKEELNHAIANFETKLKQQEEIIISKEELIAELRHNVDSKDQELHAKYSQLQNDLIKMDELQDELGKIQLQVQQRDATIASLTEEVETLRTNASVVEEDLFVTRHQLTDLLEKLEKTKSLDDYNEVVEHLHDKELLVEELESKIAQRLAEIDALKKQVESLASEKDQLQERLQEEEHKELDLLEGNKNQEEALRNAERAKAEVENRLLNLQATHEEHLGFAQNVSAELHEAYRMMELLKEKHTEDTAMLNRRLEDVLEELSAKMNEISLIQNELDEKGSAMKRSVPEEVKASLESKIEELHAKLTEAEEKAATQLEKLKKYAAVAKKKTAQCEELESKLADLEARLNSENSENEARNKELQNALSNVQEKDNRITSLEEELQHVQHERDEALQNLDAVKIDLHSAQDKINTLSDELKELSEAKENARELRVRMEVMEAEYMEQLAQINSLIAENGMLHSKQTQINERLENVEKESEERRALLEKFEKEKEIEDTRRAETTQESCGQCTTRLQALEAKLQERDAEIENLDNELHNSIGNLVQMQENLRLSTIPPPQNNSMHEAYNELMVQFNVLTATNEETRNKYEATLKDNEDLIEKIRRLQELNATMQERIDSVEKELSKDKEAAASFESLHVQYVQLVDQFDKQKAELDSTRVHLQEAFASNAAAESNLLSQIQHLEQEKQHLAQEYESLKSLKESASTNDGWDWNPDAQVQHQQKEPVTESEERQKREVDTAKDDSPPLFDASIFGGPSVQASTEEQNLEIARLRDQVSALERQLVEGRTALEEVQARLSGELHQARETIDSLTEELKNLKRNRAEFETAVAASLGSKSNNANEELDAVRAEYENLVGVLNEKNLWIDTAKSERTNYLSQLDQLTFEKQEIERILNHILSSLSIVDESSSNVQKLRSLEAKLGESLSEELEALRSQNQELSAAQEVYKNRLFELENELKTTSDSARIAELENRVARVVSERDILQLQVNDITRAFEDLKETTVNLRGLQSQLEAVIQERDQLVKELKALRESKSNETPPVQEDVQKTESSDLGAEKTNLPSGEFMWEDEEDPWGFGDRSIPQEHVNIPLIPAAEIELKLRVDELEERLKELTDENAKLIEDGKNSQIKIVKYVKKLKEYKVQLDSLHRQLNSQRSMGGFGDLDSAIEEELKAQISNLEKALGEAKEELKKAVKEKENLLQRIEVLTAATERFTEAKEKQDTEVHIWQMRYKELEMKLQQLDFGAETKEVSTSPTQQSFEANPKYEEEIKELKDNVDALAAENEELQQLLEEHRVKRQTSVEETTGKLQELQVENAKLTAGNEKLKSDYNTLRKQYEQSLMDANDQVQSMRQSYQLLQDEFAEKNAESEKIIADLNERLQEVMEEKAQLDARIHQLESEAEKFNATAATLDEVTELLNARVQEVASLKEELQRNLAEKAHQEENSTQTLQQLTDELREKELQLETLNAALLEKNIEGSKLTAELENLKEQAQNQEIRYAAELQDKMEEIHLLQEKISRYEAALSEKEHQLTSQESQLQQSATDVQQCTSQVRDQHELERRLQEAEKHIIELSAIVNEKEANLESNNEELQRLHSELAAQRAEVEETKSKLESALQDQSSCIKQEVSDVQTVKPLVEEIPVFTFASDSEKEQELEKLKAELRTKNEEIEHLKYSLNENSLTHMIQELQDSINLLYNEKLELEDQVATKNQEISTLRSQLDEYNNSHQRRKRSPFVDHEELVKLQNELHERDQQMNELRYVVAEKEAQLKSALEQASGDYDLHESAEKLRTELYEKQQELESLKFTVSELQSEVAGLRGLERLAAEDRDLIERLNSEKEEAKRLAQEEVERVLKEKENEISGLKQQLLEENESLMEALGLRERDIENLRTQIEQSGSDKDILLDQKQEELARLEAELSERERRLAELSITKDTEIHNHRVQLGEKSQRLEELIALSEEEEKQLVEMRKLLEVKEQQINGLMQQLDEKTKEYDLMQHALQRHVGKVDQSVEAQLQTAQGSTVVAADAPSSSANELDLALYMLHQRDMRCEELTHELMQLLEERDTLQLRLSNAIRVNEELRKFATEAGTSPLKDTSEASGGERTEPLVMHPSPSKSEGPVEIAKEAINLPVGEDQKALAQKLSQLRSLDQGRDIVLRDDREQRYSQQMTLLAHGDVLSKLPPEAVARLVNANYTLSRDVQSQSSILMNWLWGKSTPKVQHM